MKHRSIVSFVWSLCKITSLQIKFTLIGIDYTAGFRYPGLFSVRRLSGLRQILPKTDQQPNQTWLAPSRVLLSIAGQPEMGTKLDYFDLVGLHRAG
jgi:hypothetical protein